MAGFTNRGKYAILRAYFEANAQYEPVAFSVVLITSATAPSADTNVVADHTEVANGGGYTTGGLSTARSSGGFDTPVEDDTADDASIQVVDRVWTGSGSGIPDSGSPPRHALLVDDDTTPNVITYGSLGQDRSVSAGQTLTLQDWEFSLTE